MPFTKTPTGDTYGTKVVNLFYPWDNRTDGVSTFDTSFKNLLAEPIGEGGYYQLIKRSGTDTLNLNTPVNGSIIGMYYWSGNLLAVDYLMIVSVSTGGIGRITWYEPSTGNSIAQVVLAGGATYTGNMVVQWSEFLYQNGNIELLFTVNGRLFRAQNTVPALPGNPTVTSAPGGVADVNYLDGYAFVIDRTSIWNSNLNDPTTWTPSNFINVDSYPDQSYHMGRSGPYLVVAGAQSVQFFYNAANPTGTPLAPNTGATQHIGYSGAFCQNGDDIYFVGTMNGTHPSVYKVTGLNITEIASFQFTRFWLNRGNIFQPTPTGQPGNSIGAIIELQGHACYYIRTSPTEYSGGLPPVNIGGDSYIYDFKSQQWSQIAFAGTEAYLLSCATQISNGFRVPSKTYFGIYGDISGNAFNFSDVVYQDRGFDIECRFRTHPLDFGTYRIKFCSRVMIQADNANFPAFCTLRWSDNDYASYGGLLGLGRQIPLNNQLKQAWALGNFRARSWELSFSGNYPIRFRALEVEYNLGQA